MIILRILAGELRISTAILIHDDRCKLIIP